MATFEYIGPTVAAVIGGRETTLQAGLRFESDFYSPFTARLLARRMIKIVVPDPPEEPEREMVWTPEGAAVEAPKCGCGHDHLGHGDRTGDHHEPDITEPNQPEQGPEPEPETKNQTRPHRRNK